MALIINAIVVRNNETGEALFAQGIEDGYTYVQVLVPIKYVTEKDAKKFHSYNRERWTWADEDSGYNFGETEAHNVTGEYELITITIEKVEVA